MRTNRTSSFTHGGHIGGSIGSIVPAQGICTGSRAGSHWFALVRVRSLGGGAAGPLLHGCASMDPTRRVPPPSGKRGGLKRARRCQRQAADPFKESDQQAQLPLPPSQRQRRLRRPLTATRCHRLLRRACEPDANHLANQTRTTLRTSPDPLRRSNRTNRTSEPPTRWVLALRWFCEVFVLPSFPADNGAKQS
jgi:hypothetical protein